MMTKAEISIIKSLKDKTSRSQLTMFVAEGEKMFDEICKSNFSMKKLYFVQNLIDKPISDKINHIIKKNICEVKDISQNEMERISHLKTATPILMCIEIPKYSLSTEELKEELTIALDNVQDPGNLGTIIRIADWFGIKNVICSPTSADIYNPKVVQATMGAITRVKVHYMPLVEILNSIGGEIYGTFLDGENIYNKDVAGKRGVIVMGNEGNGISSELAKIVTERVLIPPYPLDAKTSESLNVGVATAIICNEFRRK